MFKRIKQDVETWLRSLIAEEMRAIVAQEVNRVVASLKLEKQMLDVQLQTFNEALSRLNEMSFFKENAALREHIKQMDAQLAGITDTFKRLHPTT